METRTGALIALALHPPRRHVSHIRRKEGKGKDLFSFLACLSSRGGSVEGLGRSVIFSRCWWW